MSELPSSAPLQELSELGRQLEVSLGIRDELEKAIQEENAKIARLSDVTIPELMNNLGLEEIKLKSGTKVTLQPVYGASVPDERKPEAWAWLRSHNFGALIKNTIKCEFGLGEETRYQEVKKRLDAEAVIYVAKEDVHASTLKSFVKDRYEKGETFPEKLFGAFTKTIAKIKKK
jgi:hypothetical protein